MGGGSHQNVINDRRKKVRRTVITQFNSEKNLMNREGQENLMNREVHHPRRDLTLKSSQGAIQIEFKN